MRTEASGGFSGEQLRSLRIAAGYTQSQLARALGWSRSRLCNYEQGTAQPSVDALQALADQLGVLMNDLMDDRGRCDD